MKKCKNAIVHFCFVLSLVAGLGLAGISSQTANAQGNLLNNNAPPAGKKRPLLMQADNLVYDNKRNTVTAKGNVEIYYNKYALFADKVIYDRNANTLSAKGNVRIKEPNGSVITANEYTLTDDFRDGFVQSLKIVTKDDARIAASRARRTNGNTTVFEHGVFTPCKTCRKRKYPIWRIKARKIIHKQDEKNIYYRDARLEFFGIPIAYIPYFSHPDPTVKRRSGFLYPKLSHSSELGFTYEQPYFYNIAPNKDITFNPRYTSKQGILWQGEFRHRTRTGAYSIGGQFIREDNPDAGVDRNRGSIETKGRFKSGDYWHWGWDITLESDDTFRRKYEIDNILTTNRVSKIYAIRRTERNWLAANMYHFGALTSLDASNAEAFVHPVIDYNHVFGNTVLGGELSFDANLLALSRQDGTDHNRLIAHMKWRRTMVDSLGQVYQPFFQVRGDVFQFSNVDAILGVDPSDDNYAVRGQAVAGLTYSYPWVSRTRGATHIVKPTVQIITRSNVGDQTQVPNEDARSLVFDDTTLFRTDKFSGYDRIETGTRANIGVQYILQMNSGGYAKAVFGQSIHISGENAYTEGTGLDTDRSDYVAALYLEPSSRLTLLSQARFDEKTFDVKRTDIFLRASYGPINGSVNYANIDASDEEAALGIFEDREEIQATASLQLSTYWSVFGSIRYNLADDDIIQDTLGLKYADECFVLSVTYKDSHITDGDIEPGSTVMVRFELKHLGGTSINTSIADDFTATSEDN